MLMSDDGHQNKTFPSDTIRTRLRESFDSDIALNATELQHKVLNKKKWTGLSKKQWLKKVCEKVRICYHHHLVQIFRLFSNSFIKHTYITLNSIKRNNAKNKRNRYGFMYKYSIDNYFFKHMNCGEIKQRQKLSFIFDLIYIFIGFFLWQRNTEIEIGKHIRKWWWRWWYSRRVLRQHDIWRFIGYWIGSKNIIDIR